jgi:hypothetical protein
MCVVAGIDVRADVWYGWWNLSFDSLSRAVFCFKNFMVYFEYTIYLKPRVQLQHPRCPGSSNYQDNPPVFVFLSSKG